jgi:ABC-type branched-subunit amino acid transport system substrate-binding protein
MLRIPSIGRLICLLLAGLVANAQAAEILVAQVAPLTGLEASQGRAYGAGLQLYFESINKTGGVNGSTIRLVREDDGGRPADTVALARKALADPKVLVLTGVIGSRNVRELISSGVLEGSGVPLVGYRSTEVLPDTPLVYNVRASLTDEISKMVQHVTTVGIQRLGLFYEGGGGSAALVAALDQIASKSGARVVSRASYEAGTARVTPAVDEFIKSQPQAILMVSSGAAAAAFIERYRGADGAAQLFATSGADVEQLGKRLSDEQMQGVAIAQVTPSPYTIGSRLVKEFSDLVAKSPDQEGPVGYTMLEGYIAGKVIVQALRQQRSPSRKGMVPGLNAIERFDLGGYVVSYATASKSGSRRVELTIVSSAGKVRQ